MQNVYLVRSKEVGRWWDSVRREVYEVEEGDVVGFVSFEDAQHFVKQDRAEPLTEDEIAALVAEESEDQADDETEEPPPPKPKSKPKAKRATKAKSDVQEDA